MSCVPFLFQPSVSRPIDVKEEVPPKDEREESTSSTSSCITTNTTTTTSTSTTNCSTTTTSSSSSSNRWVIVIARNHGYINSLWLYSWGWRASLPCLSCNYHNPNSGKFHLIQKKIKNLKFIQTWLSDKSLTLYKF